VVLLLAIGGAVAWYLCWIPGIQGPSCAGTPEPPEASYDCTGLDGAACYGVARKAQAAGDLETARQLCQYASDLGSNDATLCVAQMYDPQTWSAKESPVPEANWETAAFWYERAAENGSVEGQLGAGRLMCQNASTAFERRRGRSYLEKAAEGGAEDAKALLASCEASAS
jgi:TPR repeat protein